MVTCSLKSALTENELEAVRAYASEATFFHAVSQGRQAELAPLQEFQKFCQTASAHRSAIDSAIAKCTMDSSATLYSGHGVGLTIRGSLCGDASKFIGQIYRYTGYISTSSVEQIAVDSFLVKRVFDGSMPTLLEVRLSVGFHLLDMNLAGSQGEFEFLIGRGVGFVVVDALYFKVAGVLDPVLRLVLEPVAGPVNGASASSSG